MAPKNPMSLLFRIACPGLFASALLAPAAVPDADASGRTPLTSWSIQSSARVPAKGEVLSQPGASTSGWHTIQVPNTVVGGLVEAGVYKDPYFAMNLRTIPGTTYPVGERFMLLPTPNDSPFKPSWWYRTEFPVTAGNPGRRLALHFDGINYRANIWINGQQIGRASEIAGAYRRYEFDITKAARPGT